MIDVCASQELVNSKSSDTNIKLTEVYIAGRTCGETHCCLMSLQQHAQHRVEIHVGLVNAVHAAIHTLDTVNHFCVPPFDIQG